MFLQAVTLETQDLSESPGGDIAGGEDHKEDCRGQCVVRKKRNENNSEVERLSLKVTREDLCLSRDLETLPAFLSWFTSSVDGRNMWHHSKWLRALRRVMEKGDKGLLLMDVYQRL